MYRIRHRLIMFFIFMIFTNLVCIGQEIFNYSDESYDVLKAVSERTKYRLSRNILKDKRTKDYILPRLNLKTFSHSLYYGLWPIDFEDVISEEDIDELRQKINLEDSPDKWNRRKLRKLQINTKRDKDSYADASYRTSPPIFFKDNRFAIIYTSSWCGMECGAGQIEFYYKRGDETWEYFGYIMIWIS